MFGLSERPTEYAGYEWNPLEGWLATKPAQRGDQLSPGTPARAPRHSGGRGVNLNSIPLPPQRPNDLSRGHTQMPPMDVYPPRQRELPDMNIRGPSPRGPRELPPMDVGVHGEVLPDLGAQIRGDMASEAAIPLSIARAIITKNPMALAGMFSQPQIGHNPVPQLPAPQGLGTGSPLTGRVPEHQPSYWGPNGGSMAAKPPSLDDIPILDAVRNNQEFYDPTAVNQAAALVRSGKGREAMHPIYGPNANRPNYGEGLPPDVRAPFQSGPEGKSIPYWKTYVKNMHKGPLSD